MFSFYLPFLLSLSLPLFLSLSLSLSHPLPLSLSPSPSLSLYLCLSVVARHVSSDAVYQLSSSYIINLTFHTLSLHSSYKIHQPFTDYLLRLPCSELLEKHFFRSRANRRLVFCVFFLSTDFLFLSPLLGIAGLFQHQRQWGSKPFGSFLQYEVLWELWDRCLVFSRTAPPADSCRYISIADGVGLCEVTGLAVPPACWTGAP